MSRSYSITVVGSGRIIAALLALGQMVVLSRWLSREEYGVYQQVWLVFNLLSPLLILGLPASVTYFTAQIEPPAQKALALQTGGALVVIGLGISGFSFLAARPLAAALGESELSELLTAFSLYPLLTLPLIIVDALLITQGRATAAGGINCFIAVSQFAAIIVPVLLGYPLKTVFYVLNGVAILRFATIYMLVMHLYRGVRPAWSAKLLRSQFAYCIPLGLGSIMGILLQQMDRIMVSFFLDARQYAVYVNGAVEIPFVAVITGSIVSVLTPEYVRLYKDGRKKEIVALWHSATCKTAIVFFPMTGFFMVFGADLLVGLFSARYAESAALFRVFLLLLPLRITVYGCLLSAAGKTGLIFRAAAGSLVLNLVLNLILLPWLGLIGAAIASVIAVYVLALWQLGWCARLLELRWREVFPWRKLGGIALVAGLASAIAWSCTRNVDSGLMRVGVGFACFLAALLAMVPFAPRVRAELKGIVVPLWTRFSKSFQREEAVLTGNGSVLK